MAHRENTESDTAAFMQLDAKVYRSLTDPNIIAGVPFLYIITLFFTAGAVFVFLKNFIVISLAAIAAYVYGVVQTKKDPAWFIILIVNMKHLSHVLGKKVRYVASR